MIMNEKAIKSKYKGVRWDKARNKWRVCITISKKYIHLGYFTSEIEAALRYKEVSNSKKIKQTLMKIWNL